MRFRYKSVLILLCILIISCLGLGITYQFYIKYFSNKAVVVADGNLTINYLNGNHFKGKKDKTINFSVTNNGPTDETFYIKLANIYASDASYVLKGNDLNIENKLMSTIVSNQIVIASNTTLDYAFEIDNKGKDNYSGELIVALGSKISSTFDEIIIDNNNIIEKPQTSFKENSTTNEGLIKNKTEEGNIYYFRGAVTNNYVSFANYLWRIVKINADGSVKLVLNELIDTNSGYYNGTEYGFTNSLINETLSAWRSVNLNEYSDLIASYKFCNDTTIVKDSDNYAAYERLSINYIPNNSCLGTEIITNIGLLTADEVIMAGASKDGNENYYLYNSNIKTNYYTMTSAKKSNDGYYPYVVDINGAITDKTIGTQLLGVRPVINVIKNISATGKGTVEDPYVLMDI